MKLNCLRQRSFILTTLILIASACGNPESREAALEKQRADSISNAQAKMEEAKEEALRRSRVLEDSLQQSQAASSKE